MSDPRCDPAVPSVEVPIRRLDPDVPLPSYAHPGDAGADLVSTADVVLEPGERALVPTGVAIALPPGYAGFIHPRSGLAARHGVTMVNAPGTIDAGYRGEITLIMVNLDPHRPVRLARGDRVAQLVIQRVERAAFRVVAELPDSARGAGGYGSTGGVSASAPAAGSVPNNSVPNDSVPNDSVPNDPVPNNAGATGDAGGVR